VPDHLPSGNFFGEGDGAAEALDALSALLSRFNLKAMKTPAAAITASNPTVIENRFLELIVTA
jgi:phosphoheptose isomerase